ncbi:flavin-containing monooxygenase [Haliangium sp.]|uniref:flavin-containing monooxygenase n=1 Tax=Haliangium sp. TaxID=2663208 RepID=UPI003D0D321D
MRIAVIGAGISGITAARSLMQCGHEVVVFERLSELGGVWTRAYPEVRLQNQAAQYRLSDFDWPFTPDSNPTGDQVSRYWHAVVERFGIDVRLAHTIVRMDEHMDEHGDGWQLVCEHPGGREEYRFDFVVVATGHFSEGKRRLRLPGEEGFTGQVVTEREIDDLEVLRGRRVAVIGFGKSAVDMAAFAAERGAQVHHVFREARWLVPIRIFGVHYSTLLFSRVNTAMNPCWVQPTAGQRFLHQRLRPLVRGFWRMVGGSVRLQNGIHPLWRDRAVRERLRALLPRDSFDYQIRAGTALAPPAYFPAVVAGRIIPYRGTPGHFEADALVLDDGRRIPCDLVVAAMGNRSPRFPFLPDPYRALLEADDDGVQLYRHLLHPRVPRLAFAGFNHGALHVAAVEIAMLWLSAYLRGDLRLPPVAHMERCIEQIKAWKREHMLFEPARACTVNARFQHYADVMLRELGLNPYRKRGLRAELFEGYGAADYGGLIEEYEQARRARARPFEPLPLCT